MAPPPSGPGRRTTQDFSRVRLHGDAAERDADRIAERLTGAPPPVRRASTSGWEPAAPSIPEDLVSSLGAGRPLDRASRGFFEPRLGRDLGDVRVHDGARAAESAHAIEAAAFTVGRDVVFGRDRYAPATGEGRRLLAHELAHVVQQGGEPRAVQREAIESCTTPESESITEAVTRAYADCSFAIELLARRPLPDAARQALWLALRTDSDSIADFAVRNLRSIRQRMINERFVCSHPRDAGYSDHCTGTTYAYVSETGAGRTRHNVGPVTICVPNFSRLAEHAKAGAIIHESAHLALNISDTGYFSKPDCLETSPEPRSTAQADSGTIGDNPVDRLNNADSYACLVYFLRYLPAAQRRDRAATYHGDNLAVRFRTAGILGGTRIYTQTNVPSEPTFYIDGAPPDAGFHFRWRLEAGGMSYRLESARSARDTWVLHEDNREVFVPSPVRRILGQNRARRGTIVCEVELFRPHQRHPAPILRRELPVTIEEGQDPDDPSLPL
ncbi:MAG TPA: DUF4157 domain-containing protein [Thermoleophilaceae bacterium]